MFLKRNERGSAILGVLGVMGVTIVIAVTTTTVSLHAVGITTSTRASVEAEAAAEAGIDYAASKLATSVCQSSYTSSIPPIFSVVVSYSNLQTSPGTTDNSWVIGCPTSTSAQRLKLVSTGTAGTSGVAGNSSGNIRKVEAIYPYVPALPAYAIIAGGPAIYSFAQVNPTINDLTITQASTTRPSLQYLSGSATCSSNATILGDVILGSGGLQAQGDGCVINGDLWSANAIIMQAGEVTGNVNAAGVQNGISVTLGDSAIIDGNLFAAGPVSSTGKIGGNVVAGPTTGISSFSTGASVGGSVISAGTVSTRTGAIKGTTTTNKSGIVTPTIPIVPPWIDYAYSASDWVASSGTPYTVLTMSSCGASVLSSSLTTVQNSTTPIILDTRVCGAVTDLRGYSLALKSDTVIIVNGFNLGSNSINSSDSNSKRLWLIIPDTVANNSPNCPTSSYAKISSSVTVGPLVGAMIYSPCPISNAGDVWRGQMYTSSFSIIGSFTLNYLPIGLPTVNLNTGSSLAAAGTGVLGDRTSIRDLAVG